MTDFTPEQGHRDDEAAGRLAAEKGRADSAAGRDAAEAGREEAKAASDELSDQMTTLVDRSDLSQKVTTLGRGVIELSTTVSTLATSVEVEQSWRKRNTLAFAIFSAIFILFSVVNLFILGELREIAEFNRDCNTKGTDCYDTRTSAFVDTVKDKIGKDIRDATTRLMAAIEVAGCFDITGDGKIGDGVKCVPPPPLIVEVPVAANPNEAVGERSGRSTSTASPAPTARRRPAPTTTTTPGKSDGHSQACVNRPQGCAEQLKPAAEKYYPEKGKRKANVILNTVLSEFRSKAAFARRALGMRSSLDQSDQMGLQPT